MPGPAPIFRELHRLRRFARDLQEQLERIPRQLKAHQAKLAKQEQAFRDAQEAIKRLKVSASEKEKALKSLHEKIARFEKQINDVTSKKEFDALQLEISHAKAECTRLEDEILTAIVQSEEGAGALPELEKAAKQAREAVVKFETDTAPRKADLSGQLKETLAQLTVVEKTIPYDVRPRYNSAINSLGADAMAVVRDRICESCYTEITVQTQNDLEQELFVECRSCGRIQYLAEGTSWVNKENDEDEA